MQVMESTILIVELIGHLTATAAFITLILYVVFRRRRLRRVVRRATILYWLTVTISLLFAGVNLGAVVYLLARGLLGRLPWLDLISEYGSIIGQAVIIVALISARIVAERYEAGPRRILAIGAHPDDIEIGCSATLARALDSGHVVWGLILTRGEKGGRAEVRPREARTSAEFLGMEQVRVLDFPDTRLNEQIAEIRDAIEQMVREFKPDIVLTHSSHDLHQDHRAVHEATLQAARNIRSILCYESPSVTPEFHPTLFVDIGDYIDVKVESIKEHWDQHAKPYMQEEQIRAKAVFRGGQARCRYAEGFEVVRANFRLEFMA